MKYIKQILLVCAFGWFGTTHVGSTTLATISSTSLSDIKGLNISVNTNGQAMAVWSVDDGGRKIQAAYYDGSSWASAVDVPGGTDGIFPWVALNDSGKAVVAWQTGTATSGGGSILVNSFISGAWQGSATTIDGAATLVFNTNGDPTNRVHVGINAAGNALVQYLTATDNDPSKADDFALRAFVSLDGASAATSWDNKTIITDDKLHFIDPLSHVFEVHGKESNTGIAYVSVMQSNNGTFIVGLPIDAFSSNVSITKFSSFARADGISSSLSINKDGDIFVSGIENTKDIQRAYKRATDIQITSCSSQGQNDLYQSLAVNVSDNKVLHQALAFVQLGDDPFDQVAYRIALYSQDDNLNCDRRPFPLGTLDIDPSMFVRVYPMICSFDNENAVLVWYSEMQNRLGRIGILTYDGATKKWNTDNIQYINANLARYAPANVDLPFYMDCPRLEKDGLHHGGIVWWDDTLKAVRSVMANDTPTPLAPSPPTNLSAIASTTGISLTWALSPDTDIVTQRIFRSNGTDDFTDITSGSPLGSTVVTYEDTNVNDNQIYSYFVQVENSAGLTSRSNVVSTTFQGGKPTRPKAVSAQCVAGQIFTQPAITELAVVVTWAAGSTSKTDPDEQISRYNIYRGGEYIGSSDNMIFHYDDTNVEFNVEYTYYVTAVNLAGVESDPSDEATAGPCSEPVIQPRNLNATCPTITSVELTWIPAPTSTITQQRILRDGNLIATVSNTTSTYTDSSITTGQAYEYSVISINGTNQSNPATTTITCVASPPEPPSSVNAQCAPDNAKAIQITWGASDTADISLYRIYKNNTSPGNQIAEVNVNDPEGYSYIDDTISFGKLYTYYVSAYDSTTEKESSLVASQHIACQEGSPNVPTGLSATCDMATDSITLTWNPPTQNCGSQKIIRETKHLLTGNIDRETIADRPCGVGEYIDYGASIASNREYTYTIRAYNTTNTAFADSTPTTITPSDCGISPITDDDIICVIENNIPVARITWAASPTVGVTSYKIYRNNLLIGTVSSSETTFDDVSIAPGIAYEYSVAAVTATGERRSATNRKVVCTAFAEPQSISGFCTFNQFAIDGEYFKTISWVYPEGSDLSQATGQEIYRDDVLIATVQPNVLTYEDHDRPVGVPETYTVTAISDTGTTINRVRPSVTITC